MCQMLRFDVMNRRRKQFASPKGVQIPLMSVQSAYHKPGVSCAGRPDVETSRARGKSPGQDEFDSA